MGLCQSGSKRQVAYEMDQRSQEIDKQLASEKKLAQIKLLLLGSSESGKSTILKQMRILHDKGFSREELMHNRHLVYRNTVGNIYELALVRQKLNIRYEQQQKLYEARIVKAVHTGADNGSISTALQEAIVELWNDPVIQYIYNQHSQYNFSENALYFLDHLERIAGPDYIPTVQDILHTRMATIGAIEMHFDVDDIDVRIIDVGGQNSQRRKWLHLFDNVHAVVFVVAISQFDQFTDDFTTSETKQNRLIDALHLFEQIMDSKWLTKSSIILFLNKMDIFKLKIEQNRQITTAFPSYSQDNTFEATSRYIKRQFAAVKTVNKNRQLYSHYTCATQTDQMDKVLHDVLDMTFRNNLSAFGFA